MTGRLPPHLLCPMNKSCYVTGHVEAPPLPLRWQHTVLPWPFGAAIADFKDPEVMIPITSLFDSHTWTNTTRPFHKCSQRVVAMLSWIEHAWKGRMSDGNGICAWVQRDGLSSYQCCHGYGPDECPTYWQQRPVMSNRILGSAVQSSKTVT